MRLTTRLTIPVLGALAVCGLALQGCSDGSSGGKKKVAEVDPHDSIVLKDRLGQPIALGSTEPYSPRQTCGGSCHDIDEIANGYHFQQGRTDADGAIAMADDFYQDGRKWLQSDGMYGKW